MRLPNGSFAGFGMWLFLCGDNAVRTLPRPLIIFAT